jgi:hypothetical protein
VISTARTGGRTVISSTFDGSISLNLTVREHVESVEVISAGDFRFDGVEFVVVQDVFLVVP